MFNDKQRGIIEMLLRRCIPQASPEIQATNAIGLELRYTFEDALFYVLKQAEIRDETEQSTIR
jgi:hypothetical protein